MARRPRPTLKQVDALTAEVRSWRRLATRRGDELALIRKDPDLRVADAEWAARTTVAEMRRIEQRATDGGTIDAPWYDDLLPETPSPNQIEPELNWYQKGWRRLRGSR